MSLRTSALGLSAAIIANAALVVVAIVASAAVSPVHSDLQFITRGKSNRLIIFVDSLSNDPTKTFRWGQGMPSWPELMAADGAAGRQQLPLARYDTALLSFAGAAQNKQSIPQLATSGLAELNAKGILDTYEGITFVAYSAGGLVLKSMLIQSAMAGSKLLTDKTKVVFLLSVPAQGRSAADFLSGLMAKQSLVANFGTIDVPVFLQGLESLWAEHLASRGPTKPLKVYCLHETEPTYGVPVLAGQYSAEGCDDSGELAGTDHTTIAKPSSRAAGAYQWVKTHLTEYYARFPADAGKAKAGPQVAAIDVPATSPAKLAAKPAAAAASQEPAAVAPAPAPKPPVSVATAEPPAPVSTPFTPEPPAEPNLPPPADSTAFALPAPTLATPASEARRRSRSRPVPPVAARPPPRPGDWTFHVKGPNCNLATQLWVVKIAGRRIRSDSWDGSIGNDGNFTVQHTSYCLTERVHGGIAGKSGSGWYLYSDPCAQIYCQARFKMTWRLPQPADIARR